MQKLRKSNAQPKGPKTDLDERISRLAEQLHIQAVRAESYVNAERDLIEQIERAYDPTTKQELRATIARQADHITAQACLISLLEVELRKYREIKRIISG